MLGKENRSARSKRVPVPFCPPEIPHDLSRGSNPGRRGGKPVTNHLSYGTALKNDKFCIEFIKSTFHVT
jgi:hypothetical protein